MKIPIPGLKLENTANGSQGRTRKGGAIRAKKRSDTYSDALKGIQLGLLGKQKPTLPLIVTIIRVAPRKLDSDGLALACKQVRDAVAYTFNPKVDANGRVYGDDRDGGPITWRYWQRAGRPREYACELLVEERQQVALRRWDGVDVWRDIVRGGGLKAPELRAFIVQCEAALDALMEAEHG